MAKNITNMEAVSLSLACSHPTTPQSGYPVRIGHMVSVALTNETADGKTTVYLHQHVANLSVKGVNDAGNSAVSLFDPLYYADADINDGTGFLSKKDSGYFAGLALATVNSGSTTSIDVLMIPGLAPGSANLLAAIIETADIADDAVTNDKIANITRGSVKVGGAANAPTDLDAKTSGQILVGDGTDVVSVAVSGDATLAANGAISLAADSVGKAEFAGGINKSELVAGQDETGDTTIPVSGMAAGDELVGFYVQDGTSGIFTMRAIADFTVGAAELTVVANAANNAANKYFILWNDLTA